VGIFLYKQLTLLIDPAKNTKQENVFQVRSTGVVLVEDPWRENKYYCLKKAENTV